ncbi:MAG: HD domain-containing protein [Lachnospiraceae bacterium]|nr:HD domain-containing protein [Lachnospiraceae bacterium]
MDKRKRNILIIDNTGKSRNLLKDSLRDHFMCFDVDTGEKGLRVVTEVGNRLSAVLINLVMSRVNAEMILTEMNKQKLIPGLPVIVMLPAKAAEEENRVYGLGAMDVIHKPYDPTSVVRHIRSAIDMEERLRKDSTGADPVSVLSRMIMQQSRDIERQRDNNNHIIDAICSIVEFRHLESGFHMQRIREFTRILASLVMNNYPEYGISPGKIDIIVQAAAWHDIGKLVIPDAIILKPGKLTADEFDVMKSHTTRGAGILETMLDKNDTELFSICSDVARHHHEKFDGGGYPDKLVGDTISMPAQICGLADIFDALNSDRSYKAAVSPDRAFEMIVSGETGAFNPKLLNCFKMGRAELEGYATTTRQQEKAQQEG